MIKTIISKINSIFGINSTIHIKVYTLIREKDFQICKKKEKKIATQKLLYVVNKQMTVGFP